MVGRAWVGALILVAIDLGSAAAQPSSTAPSSSHTATCMPACRAGYMCVDGTCVEACNPPCGAGTSCNANAECRPTEPLASESSAGWARAGGAFGVVAATVSALALVAGLATDDRDTQIGLGLGVWGLLAVSVPIAAAGGRSARRGHARGRVGLRVVGWIGWVVTLVLGGVALGLAINDEDIPTSVSVPLVLLAITSELAFAVDAYASASQARFGF